MKDKNAKNRLFPQSSKHEKLQANTHSFPLSEADDFLDPFSDLNIYLAKKIKEEIHTNFKSYPSKQFIETLSNEFNVKFPGYHLGMAALKVLWKKVTFYLDTFNHTPDAYDAKGQLNLHYLIRQSIDQNIGQIQKDIPHAYAHTHQMATQLSECLVTIDGKKPHIESLDNIIWSQQKHLLTRLKQEKLRQNENWDAVDKLIIRFLLEYTSQKPDATHPLIVKHLESRLAKIHALTQFDNSAKLEAMICSSFAKKLYPQLGLLKKISQRQLKQIEAIVRKQIRTLIYKKRTLDSNAYGQLLKRLILLYRLSSKMQKDQAEKQLHLAIHYVMSLSTDKMMTGIPTLNPSVFEFIQNELLSTKGSHDQDPLQTVLSNLLTVFEDVKSLPRIEDAHLEDLEVIFWKILDEEVDLFAPSSKQIQTILDDELSYVYIDNHSHTFGEIVRIALGYVRKLQALPQLKSQTNPLIATPDSITYKIHFWATQNDLVVSKLMFDSDLPLFKLIAKKEKKLKTFAEGGSIEPLIDEVLQATFKSNPKLIAFTQALRTRTIILVKHYWYNLKATANESHLDRLASWHYQFTLTEQAQNTKAGSEQLKHILQEALPLLPIEGHIPSHLTETTSQANTG
ncbi:MAG: hypothetical protein S4CHLAM102_10190 [Chlamydiia bacterium]|nr:hypothetical protein [Chlamydiia bacterium]